MPNTTTYEAELDQRTRGIYRLLQERLRQHNTSPFMLTAPTKERTSLADIGLVQCVFGKNEKQLAAIRKAWSYLAQSNPWPAKWIVIEAQTDVPVMQELCEQYGFEHHFYQLTDDQTELFQKEALWNIGEKMLPKSVTKVVFIDADVAFCHYAWLTSCSQVLADHDVISCQCYSYYADQTEIRVDLSTAEKLIYGCLGYPHPGFTLGFRRDYLRKFKLLVCSSSGGDTTTWGRLSGDRDPKALWYDRGSYNWSEFTRVGYDGNPPPRIGVTGEICFHCNHSNLNERRYRARRMLTRAACTYDREDLVLDERGIVKWADNDAGWLHRRTAKWLRELSVSELTDRDLGNLHTKATKELYGEIDEQHPLIVASSLRLGGPYGRQHLVMLQTLMRRYLKTPHQFYYFADEDLQLPNATFIPFELSAKEAPYFYCQLELFRNVYPQNASVFTIDLDAIPIAEFELPRCKENTIAMGMEQHNWDWAGRSLWNGGMTYFRGDFSYLYQSYANGVRGNGLDPFFSFISSQEYFCGVLFKHQQPIEDLLKYVWFEFYDQYRAGLTAPYFNNNTRIMHFLATPKPWTLKTKPWWLPQEAFSVGGGDAYSSKQ